MKLSTHHLATPRLLLQITTCFRSFSIKCLRHWCRGKLELHSCQNHEQATKALMHRTVNPKVQGLIPAHDNFFFFSVPPFRDTPFHISAIDNDYSAICAHIKTIHTQNETLTIWLHRKVYCKLLCVFLRLVQHIEGHDVEKTSAAFHC